MTGLEQFHWLRPAWLLALLGLAPILWLAWREQRAPGAWRRVCDPTLLRHLLLEGGGRSARWPVALLAVGWTLACLALAGPTWQRLPQPAYREPRQTVFVLSLAPSMAAGDVAPSRVVRARYELLDALARVEGTAGLVIYSDEPYPVTPLTDDPQVIAAQVGLLEPRIMPGRGARLDRAIDEAKRLLVQAGAASGSILVLGDGLGEAPDAALDAASGARDAGFPVSALDVGGADADLSRLARAGGGRFARATADDGDWDSLLREGPAGLDPAGRTEQAGVRADVWRDAGAWLVLGLVALAPLAFRRGWAAGFVLLLLLTADPPAARASLDDWLLRRDQQGAAALAQGDAKAAAGLFEDPEWKAVARYRAGDYAGAAEALEAQPGARARYNLGNALARSGRLQEALAAYDQALAIDPDHEDARFNRELVKQLLEQQQQQSQQPPSQPPQDESQPNPQQQGQPQPQAGSRSPDDAGSGGGPPQPAEAEGSQDARPAEADGSEGSQPERSAQQPPRRGSASSAAPELSERDQEVEQWLNRVPDDPAGLLREKLRRLHAARRFGGR